MRKLLKRLTFIFVAVSGALFLEACGETKNILENDVLIVNIIGPNGVPVKQSDGVRLCVAQVWRFALDASVVVSSEDSSIVSVRREGNEYVVTGVKLGLTQITFRKNNITAPPLSIPWNSRGL
jgi:hypothetical protein